MENRWGLCEGRRMVISLLATYEFGTVFMNRSQKNVFFRNFVEECFDIADGKIKDYLVLI